MRRTPCRVDGAGHVEDANEALAAQLSPRHAPHIGELPLELQSKLLRVLQEGEIEKLGSSEVINVDCRVIAATNRNLTKEVEEGKFREDLFYRLNVFPIQIPALRDRIEDLKPLVEKFVAENNKKLGKNISIIINN